MILQAFILAGGKSSRMGADKGLLLYREKPLVLHTLDALREVAAERCLITSNPAYAGFGYPLLQDEVAGLGPAGGVLTALRNARTEYILVTACDMPNLAPGLLRRMMAGLEGNPDVIVPGVHQRMEPLLALYKVSILPHWERMLQSGTRKMTDFFDQLNTAIFEATNDPDYHPEMFRNVNTREDLST